MCSFILILFFDIYVNLQSIWLHGFIANWISLDCSSWSASPPNKRFFLCRVIVLSTFILFLWGGILNLLFPASRDLYGLFWRFLRALWFFWFLFFSITVLIAEILFNLQTLLSDFLKRAIGIRLNYLLLAPDLWLTDTLRLSLRSSYSISSSATLFTPYGFLKRLTTSLV